MKITDCCISGSYILQCIINEQYESDIDFFISYKYLDEVKELLKILGIEQSVDRKNEGYDKSLFKPNFTVMTAYYYNSKIIDRKILRDLNRIDKKNAVS